MKNCITKPSKNPIPFAPIPFSPPTSHASANVNNQLSSNAAPSFITCRSYIAHCIPSTPQIGFPVQHAQLEHAQPKSAGSEDTYYSRVYYQVLCCLMQLSVLKQWVAFIHGLGRIYNTQVIPRGGIESIKKLDLEWRVCRQILCLVKLLDPSLVLSWCLCHSR